MSLTHRLFSDMHHLSTLFDEAFNHRGSSLVNVSRYPATDIVEHSDSYELTAELPGYDKKDIKIEWTDNRTLLLSGSVDKQTSKEETKQESNEPKYWYKERTHGSFSRSFSFPDTIDSDKITAKFENGVLKVTIPKSVAKKPRQIKL